MNIVIDTNIFISALIKNSTTRKIIVNSKHNLLFPEFEFEEIKEHKSEIMRKSGLSEREFNVLLIRLLNYVHVVPTDILIEHRAEAQEIMGKIDEDDVIFVAAALSFNAAVWTEDKHFRRQNE